MFKRLIFLISFCVFLPNQSFAAADSYRWLHVTIDTPWSIFLFLLPMVLLPAILMAILYWRYAVRHAKQAAAESTEQAPK